MVGSTAAGEVEYETHQRIEMLGDKTLLLQKLRQSATFKKLQKEHQGEWNKIKRKGKRREVRYRKVRLSRKILNRAWCKCMKIPNKPNQTSCRYCSPLCYNLPAYHAARAGWHQAAGECNACEGLCHPGSPYRQISSRGGHSVISAVCCPAVRQRHLDMPLTDKNDLPHRLCSVLRVCLRKAAEKSRDRQGENGLPFTEEVVNVVSDVVGRYFPHVQTFCMPPSTCVMGKCDKCGLGNVFAKMNGGNSIPCVVDGVEHQLRGCCPIEATDDPYEWKVWGKIHVRTVRQNGD